MSTVLTDVSAFLPPAWRYPTALLLALWTAVLVSLFDTFSHMAMIWWTREIYHYGLIIPFISAILVIRKRSKLFQMSPAPDSKFLLPWVLCLAVWLVGDLAEARLITHFGAMALVVLAVPLTMGWQVARIIRFPLVYLMISIPFGEDFVPYLQILTADASIALLKFIGLPMTTEGVLIYTDFGNFEVARACAGVRFFLTSAVVGLLLSHLLFDRWWRKVAMVGVSLIVPIVANIIRVVSIILLAKASDIGFAKDVDHIIYGWVFLGIVLFLVITLAYRFSDHSIQPLEKIKTGVSIASDTQHFSPRKAIPSFTLAALLVVVMPSVSAGRAIPVAPPEVLMPVVKEDCTNCVSRLIDPLLVPESSLALGADKEREQLYRYGGQLIRVYRGWLAPDPAYQNRQKVLFSSPFPAFDAVPGLKLSKPSKGSVGRLFVDKAGHTWIVRAFLATKSALKGQRRLVLQRFKRGDRLLKGDFDQKIDRAAARFWGRDQSVDYTLLVLEKVGDWEEALDTIDRFLAERPLQNP